MRIAEASFPARNCEVTVTLDLLREATAGPVRHVALVHGLGASPSVWDQCVALLPDTVQAWSFGLPWDAKNGSAWALDPDSRIWLERALDLSPVQLDVYIAHSFGAGVLLDLLVKRGSPACEGLVLLSPFYRATPEEFDWAAISHYLNDFDDLVRTGIVIRRGALALPRSAVSALALPRSAVSAIPSDDMLGGMIERVRERIGPYGWMRFFDLFTRMPMLDLSIIDVPCLVVAGGRDTAAYPADCQSLARELPNATFAVLRESGHFTMVDDPPGAAEHISGFLKGLIA